MAEVRGSSPLSSISSELDGVVRTVEVPRRSTGERALLIVLVGIQKARRAIALAASKPGLTTLV